MPDNTPLGELDVVIGADWSDLESSINDAVAAATTGASAIADAFSDTGTFAAMSTAIQDLQTWIVQVSVDLDNTAEAVGVFASALTDAQGSIDSTVASVSALSDARSE